MEHDEAEMFGAEQEQVLPLSEARDLLDMVYLINALLQNEGNISRAAEDLGTGRRTIYDMMEKYGISCTNGKLSIGLSPLLIHLEVHSPFLKL